MILVRFATLWFAVLVGFVALTALKRRHPSLLAGRHASQPGHPGHAGQPGHAEPAPADSARPLPGKR
jgi:hypothetical protein